MGIQSTINAALRATNQAVGNVVTSQGQANFKRLREGGYFDDGSIPGGKNFPIDWDAEFAMVAEKKSQQKQEAKKRIRHKYKNRAEMVKKMQKQLIEAIRGGKR